MPCGHPLLDAADVLGRTSRSTSKGRRGGRIGVVDGLARASHAQLIHVVQAPARSLGAKITIGQLGDPDSTTSESGTKSVQVTWKLAYINQ